MPHETRVLTCALATVVSTAVLDNLKYYAEWAAAAYCNSESPAGDEVSCSAGACPTVGSEDTSIVATFKYVQCQALRGGITPFFPLTLMRCGLTSANRGKITDIEGFIATDASRDLIVVSVRGSDSDANWITE